MRKNFGILLILISACMVSMVSCDKEIPDSVEIPNSGDDEKLLSELSSVEFVAWAGQKSYWKHAGITVRSAETRVGDSIISYPFQTLTIKRVTRYTAQPFDVPSLSDTKNVSEDVKQFAGINELFITEFSTDGNEGRDLLLTFKYSNSGEYSCVLNGHSLYEGKEKMEFSSHIQLTKDAIEKNLSFPIYVFYISSPDMITYSFGYIYRLSEYNHGPSAPEFWFPLLSPDVIDANDVYDMTEFNNTVAP